MRRFCVTGGLLTVVLLAAPAGARMVVRTVDGREIVVNVSRHQVRAIVFDDGGSAPPSPRSMRLFHAVPRQDSKAFKHRRHGGLRVQTTRWDRIPYHMRNPVTRTVVVGPGQHCWLSGDANATRGWSVDNFLLVELVSPGGPRRWIIGDTEPVRSVGNVTVPQIGRNKQGFGAKEIDLAPHLPRGVPVRLRFSALDYGGVGQLSDLFLVVR